MHLWDPAWQGTGMPPPLELFIHFACSDVSFVKRCHCYLCISCSSVRNGRAALTTHLTRSALACTHARMVAITTRSASVDDLTNGVVSSKGPVPPIVISLEAPFYNTQRMRHPCTCMHLACYWMACGLHLDEFSCTAMLTPYHGSTTHALVCAAPPRPAP